MTSATLLEEEVDLNRSYTEEEREALYEACMDALMRGDVEESDRIRDRMPLPPRRAKIVAEVMGKQYLQEHFNITHANEVYGEGWLNEIRENVWRVSADNRRSGKGA